MKLLVNNEAECTLEEYIHTNTQEPDVDHLEPEDIDVVKNLKVGESAYFGHGDVKRVS